MTNDFLTPTQAAKLLSVSMSTIYKLIDDGVIKAVRVGPKLLRIDKQQLNKFLKGQE
jgi:excisionase family DNA binding protein